MQAKDKFRIGIIGGAGGMGRWFGAFFEQAGYTVHVSGHASGPRPAEMAAACPVVIVSVPIGVTEAVIREVGPHMKKDSLLMDLTSLKAGPVRAMLEASASEVVGLHPLFGPGVPSLEGQNVVLCPARADRWLPWLRRILGDHGAKIVETTPERHDEIMAVVQSLNHLNTLVLGLSIREAGISREELERFSTPLFRTRLEAVENLFSHPQLYAEIIAGNPHISRILDLHEKAFGTVKPLASQQGAKALEAKIRRENRKG
ncbi:MAG TPA: prephenate dehydrogenase/arogenate dehydrogenase family protein [Syntrophales bacterium]|nr:prephenate dehydrogenase/arogenate dehydrogenase family protein [Syntrophales bacterium]